jgi:nucleoside-diphosphate-sugar epimerase
LDNTSVLITGISGFTGPYVRDELERRGCRVVGLANSKSARVADLAVDLLDASALRECVARIRPDYIVHLAGLAFVAHDDAADCYRNNLLGTLNLLEAADRSKSPLKKIVLASSANVYGRPARLPVDESAATLPLSHYGASKLAMEHMARIWFGRLPILIVRPFNYTGVGQSSKYVVAKLAEFFRKRAPEMELGDTSVVREFMDVRDVAHIYAELLASASTGDLVNICAGRGYRLDEVLGMLEGLSRHSPRVRRAPGLMRGNDIPELVGSPARLEALVGKLAFRPFEETLRWMLGA